MSVSMLVSASRSRARSHAGWIVPGCFGLPVLILAVSYAWLAIEANNGALWNTVVHESGRYTLSQTIFYTDHFLREILIDVTYASFLAVFFVGRSAESPAGRRSYVPVLAGFTLAIALATGAFLISAGAHGIDSALKDLLQYRTRDDLLAYGSHWRFHWLSTLWFGAAAWTVVHTLVRPRVHAGGLPRWLAWSPWLMVALLTVVFGLDRDVFVDTRFVGHQAREIVTHGSVTLPLGYGALLVVDRWLRPRSTSRGNRPGSPPSSRAAIWIAATAVVAIPLYVGIATLVGNPMEAGQSSGGLAPMVAGHYFEHVLDYVFVTALAVFMFGSFQIARSGASTS